MGLDDVWIMCERHSVYRAGKIFRSTWDAMLWQQRKCVLLELDTTTTASAFERPDSEDITQTSFSVGIRRRAADVIESKRGFRSLVTNINQHVWGRRRRVEDIVPPASGLRSKVGTSKEGPLRRRGTVRRDQ